MEYLSFNSTSKYYSNLCSFDRKTISEKTFSVNETYLSSWLHSLSVLRNICAHYGYLFQRDFPIKPKLPKNETANRRLHSMFLVIRELVDHKKWDAGIEEVERHLKENQNFDLSDYGFPDNWQSMSSIYHRN